MRDRNALRFHHLVVLLATAAAVIVVPALSAGTVYHKHMMKGSILSTHDDGVYLCVGAEHGAVAGQVLDVVKVVRVHGGSPKAAPRYERRRVGKVRIDALVNGHYARATVVAGEARQGDFVMLKG